MLVDNVDNHVDAVLLDFDVKDVGTIVAQQYQINTANYISPT